MSESEYSKDELRSVIRDGVELVSRVGNSKDGSTIRRLVELAKSLLKKLRDESGDE